MTPDRAPTVHELLAFYLEAGVDCALMDEPVNRVSDEQRRRSARSAAIRAGQNGAGRDAAGARRGRARA